MSSITSSYVPGTEVFGPRRGRLTSANRVHSIAKSGCFVLLLALVLINSSQPASAQQTLFTTQTPALTGQNDGVSYELGMKFQSSVSGQITAIRYWKDASESGTHVGNIWSSTGGVPLASATFASETTSGWQQQALASPLNIQANTTYVVSVNINSFYVATVGPKCYPCVGSSLGLYFPISNGALTSLADDNNGVFVNPAGAFPTQTFQFSNYFRDVVFTPGVPNPPQPAGCFEKLVSVDGGNTFAAYTDITGPAVAQPNTPVEFKLVVTNCGASVVTPRTVDDCINADPKAVPFACAPGSSGGLGAPGLIIYEPPVDVPTPSIGVGASVTYDKNLLQNLLVSASDFAALCQTAITLTGKSEVRNDAQFDGTDANGNPVSYEADAYVQCPAPSTGKTFTIGPSSMEGDLKILPGDWVSGGYSFKFVDSSHAATMYTVAATVTVPVKCPNGTSGGSIVIPLGQPGALNGGGVTSYTYSVPAGNTNWLPTGDANSIFSWDGAVQAPALCGAGVVMRNQTGAIFTTNVTQSPHVSLVDWRFKYRDPNAKGKGNVNCTDASDPRRNDAATCGASWSQTVRDP